MSDSFADCLTVARAELVTAQRLLGREIRSYPTPIAGCDAQFNHLLAQRTRISDALAQLDAPVFVPTPRAPAPDAGIQSR